MQTPGVQSIRRYRRRQTKRLVRWAMSDPRVAARINDPEFMKLSQAFIGLYTKIVEQLSQNRPRSLQALFAALGNDLDWSLRKAASIGRTLGRLEEKTAT